MENNNVYKVDIKGYQAELPVLPLPSGIKICFFNLHGNVQLTEHCGKELAKYLGDCEVLYDKSVLEEGNIQLNMPELHVGDEVLVQ